MIRCGNGFTQISGSTLDIIQDFTNVILSVRKCLCEKMPAEDADKIIALAGVLAYADGDHEQEEHTVKMIADVLKS